MNYRNAQNLVQSLECYGNSTKEREFETSLYQRYSEISRGIQRLLRGVGTALKVCVGGGHLCPLPRFRHPCSYFATIGGKTAQAVKQLSLDNNLQPYIHNQPPAATESNRPIPFDFVAVSEDEIKRIIMSMPTNKSAGPDKINIRIIRQWPYILTPLTNIINSSLSSKYIQKHGSWQRLFQS